MRRRAGDIVASALLTVSLGACGPAGEAGTTSEVDLFAPAREGLMECEMPDFALKTCNALTSYRFQQDGSVMVHVSVVMQDSPRIVMHGRGRVQIDGNRLCGEVEPSDIDAASFTIAGSPASNKDTLELREMLKRNLNARADALCSEYFPADDVFRKEAYIGDVRHPEFDALSTWVAPTDGYSVPP